MEDNTSMDKSYSELLEALDARIDRGVEEASRAVFKSMLSTYWDMGHDIVEYEQDGKAYAIYGSALMRHLLKILLLEEVRGIVRQISTI